MKWLRPVVGLVDVAQFNHRFRFCLFDGKVTQKVAIVRFF
jgi:hypothetical protein